MMLSCTAQFHPHPSSSGSIFRLCLFRALLDITSFVLSPIFGVPLRVYHLSFRTFDSIVLGFWTTCIVGEHLSKFSFFRICLTLLYRHLNKLRSRHLWDVGLTCPYTSGLRLTTSLG